MVSKSKIPVINGLSDSHHPCQALADLQTLMQRRDNAEKEVPQAEPIQIPVSFQSHLSREQMQDKIGKKLIEMCLDGQVEEVCRKVEALFIQSYNVDEDNQITQNHLWWQQLQGDLTALRQAPSYWAKDKIERHVIHKNLTDNSVQICYQEMFPQG